VSKSNLAASIRQRLKNRAKEKGESFNLILVRFGLERLLYRLTATTPKDEFVLKGGSLFYCWTEQLHRPTRDIDLLGKGEASPERFRKIFLNAIQAEIEDGLVFDHESLEVATMKDDQKYRGIRVAVLAFLGNAKVNLQVDIGFGDATTPDPTQIQFPVLLDFPVPEILAYQKETVIAEKFQAMVDLGIANSRMKDFFDLWTLAKEFEFDGLLLANAIEATFNRRETQIPKEAPLALTSEFADDASKQNQWKAFSNKLELNESLADVTESISMFLMPCVASIHDGKPFEFRWENGEWV
jgi:predicted nucleotidyltransferase component of viral defense system